MKSPPDAVYAEVRDTDPDVLDAAGLTEHDGRLAALRAWVDAEQVRSTRARRRLAEQGQTADPASSLSRDGKQSSKDAKAAAEREEVCTAMPSFEEALSSGDVSAGHVDAIANATRNLDEAETCFEFAVQHDVAFQGASGGYTPLGNLALLRAEQGHFDDALSVLQQARRRNQQGNKDARSMAISSANLGMVHHFRDDLPAALADLDRAAIEATAIGDERLLAHVLAHRGAVHGRLGQPDASSSDLARARELAQPEQTPILDALAAAATADVDREGAALTLSRLTQQAPRRCTTRLAVGLLAAALG